MYVYLRSESGLYTVGHYAPDSKWHAESDHATPEGAAERVHWLNGGQRTVPPPVDGSLLAAAESVLAGLLYRMDEATKNGRPVPVFQGLAALAEAIQQASPPWPIQFGMPTTSE